MPAGAVMMLVAGALALWLPVRLAARRVAPHAPTPSAVGVRSLTAGIVGVVLIGAGGTTSVPVFLAASGVAALATAVAIAVRLELAVVGSGPAYALPTLAHRSPGTRRTITAAAAAASAAAAFLLAALAYRVRLLGPSDPALVALAAYLGMLLECGLERAGRAAGALTAGVAAAVAALLAGALVVLLP